MKLLLSLVYIIGLAGGLSAQTTTLYYNSRPRPDKEAVAPEKARYKETTTVNADGSITNTVYNLKKNRIEFSSTLKGEEPIGEWVVLTGTGPQALDYSFELKYAAGDCGDFRPVEKFWINHDSIQYKTPVPEGGDSSPGMALAKLIHYPSAARRNGIHGTVLLRFLINDRGEIEHIVVVKGVNVIVDKEAVRALRALKFISPPTIGGKPQAICATFPVTFKAAQ